MKGLLRLRWRHARWILLVAAVPFVWACNNRSLAEPKPIPSRSSNNIYKETINRDVDILFLVDTSQSMEPLQQKLATEFPAFMNVLKDLPGGLPNVHVGIISSDMGAGPETGVPGCRPGGDSGAFQTAPRTPCMASGLNAGQAFIQSVNGTQNFTGDIAAVFSCMARLGDTGCGFEHQFASMLKALEGNTTFLRPNAYLSIVLITNEDDCSAPENSDIFSPNSRLVSDPLGPLGSFRCNEFGHVCNGAKPPRAATGPLMNCSSAEDGRLLRVADVVARTKALKPNAPEKILVAAIAGQVTPYEVQMINSNGAGGISEDQPNIKHSCSNNDGTYADPGVRIKQWTDAFGANGVFLSICDDMFSPALMRIAQEISRVIGPKCVVGKLADKNGGWPIVEGEGPGDHTPTPDCNVSDNVLNNDGVRVETPVPACDPANPNVFPCWRLTNNAATCPGADSRLVTIDRGMMMAPPDLDTRVECAICVPGPIKDPRCNYN